MAYELIRVREQHDGCVTEITLGPAPGNIITAPLMKELSWELGRINRSGEPHKLIVFRGAGDHFSYGASVEEHKPEHVSKMLPQFHQLLREILVCPVPTVARVSGLCLGGGFELALACSLIFAAEDAKFGVPEILLGVFPPAASVLLPAKTTDSAACEIVLTGRKFSAAELHRLGIINTVANGETLDDELGRFIEKEILPKSASSLRHACKAARLVITRHYDAHIAAVEKLYLEELMPTKDAVEGINAFLEKRPPEWVDA